MNTFVSSRRRRSAGEHPTAEVPDATAPDETRSVDVADAVTRSLDRLGDDQRAVVVLRYYAHLSEQQTASALGIPAGTVKSRLSRALTTLADDPDLAELRGTT